MYNTGKRDAALVILFHGTLLLSVGLILPNALYLGIGILLFLIGLIFVREHRIDRLIKEMREKIERSKY